MDVTITIRGREGRFLFFDNKDRKTFRWALSLLPDHLANDLRTHERCAIASHCEFSHQQAVITATCYDWNPEQVAKFICKVYDAYFRRKYKRDGKQSEYTITT